MQTGVVFFIRTDVQSTPCVQTSAKPSPTDIDPEMLIARAKERLIKAMSVDEAKPQTGYRTIQADQKSSDREGKNIRRAVVYR